MVARIRSGKSLKGAINYNEHKVKEGKAALLMAKGYSKDILFLKFSDKLNRLKKLADLNTRVVTNCVHLSLNFDINENIGKEKLELIAASYMDKIGFGKQPFLVYEHKDAAHQHIHIVTTTIQKDGKRLSLHNIGRVQSEKARKEIEITFGLVKAGDKGINPLQPLQAIKLEKVMYGKAETKRSISNIVTGVVCQYKFASLPEFNAVLKQYNVIADRGPENSRMFGKKGLIYSLVDEKGNKMGKPVKASSIYGKPVLARLESMYETNKEGRQPFKEKIKNTIDQVLKKKQSKASFANTLRHEGIDVVYRINEQGFLYGITYVDHTTKSVFNGSELGKIYSAAAMQETLLKTSEQSQQISASRPVKETMQPAHMDSPLHQMNAGLGMLDIFIEPSNTYHHLPYGLKKKRKRRNRKTGL